MTKQELRLARWQEKNKAMDGRGGAITLDKGGEAVDGGYANKGQRKGFSQGKSRNRKSQQNPERKNQNSNNNDHSATATLGFGGISAASATERTHMKNKGTIVAGSLQGGAGNKKIKFDD